MRIESKPQKMEDSVMMFGRRKSVFLKSIFRVGVDNVWAPASSGRLSGRQGESFPYFTREVKARDEC
jgi:hypothetical protein